jgi:hypothetical protein
MGFKVVVVFIDSFLDDFTYVGDKTEYVSTAAFQTVGLCYQVLLTRLRNERTRKSKIQCACVRAPFYISSRFGGSEGHCV